MSRIGSTSGTTTLDRRRNFYSCIRHLLVHSNILDSALSYGMLCHSHNQLGLLHGDGAGMLSHMPTVRLQLGSVDSRHMWRPEVPGSVHRSLQLANGHRNRHVTTARLVGASNADWKESRFDRHIFYGHSVRKAFSHPVFSLLKVPFDRRVTDGCHSICIITLVRIKVTTDINAQNTAAQYSLIALLTCLEATLGVVNACLPVMKPVIDKLKPTSFISVLSGWTSSKRGVPPRDYELPSKPKQIGWRLDDQPKRILQRYSQDSAIDMQNMV